MFVFVLWLIYGGLLAFWFFFPLEFHTGGGGGALSALKIVKNREKIINK